MPGHQFRISLRHKDSYPIKAATSTGKTRDAFIHNRSMPQIIALWARDISIVNHYVVSSPGLKNDIQDIDGRCFERHGVKYCLGRM